MALVKRVHSDRLVKDAVVLDLGDLGLQAERLLAEARVEAEAIVAAARGEAQRLIDGAAQQGYAAGRAKGIDEGRAAGEEAARAEVLESFKAKLDALAVRWLAAVEQWEHDRSRMLMDARQDVLRLAMDIARKVVHRTCAADPSVVVNQVEAALDLLSRPTAVDIRIHPVDRPLVEQVLPALTQRVGVAAHVTIVDDQAIESGGCIVRTAGGEIDATIQTQLDRIAAALGVESEDSAASHDMQNGADDRDAEP